jgi:uncharacterized protein (TIGR02301 family)
MVKAVPQARCSARANILIVATAAFAALAFCAPVAAAPRDPQSDGGGRTAKAKAHPAPAGKEKGAKTKPDEPAKPGAKGEPGKTEPGKQEGETPQAPPEPPPPPYEPRILRLAEILGALAYLDDLCGAKSDWRARMQLFIEAEAKTADRKERIAGSFNRSFHDYELSYPSCTPSAQLIITRFLSEGGQVAREIVNRFSAS